MEVEYNRFSRFEICKELKDIAGEIYEWVSAMHTGVHLLGSEENALAFIRTFLSDIPPWKVAYLPSTELDLRRFAFQYLYVDTGLDSLAGMDICGYFIHTTRILVDRLSDSKMKEQLLFYTFNTAHTEEV
jgi:hypothetical protein